jgi:hypothetical protein
MNLQHGASCSIESIRFQKTVANSRRQCHSDEPLTFLSIVERGRCVALKVRGARSFSKLIRSNRARDYSEGSE